MASIPKFEKGDLVKTSLFKDFSVPYGTVVEYKFYDDVNCFIYEVRFGENKYTDFLNECYLEKVSVKETLDVCEQCRKESAEPKFCALCVHKNNHVKNDGGEEAKKNDQGKDMWTALPWNALTLCVKGMTHGANKYGKKNYLVKDGLEVDRCLDAAGRHFSQYLCGEVIDKDSGLPHLTLATCELLMAQEIIIKRGEEENV